MAKIKLIGTIPDQMLDMINEIMEATYAKNRMEMFRNLVLSEHRRMFGAKKSDKKHPGERICEMLEGTIDNGMCTFTRYAAFGQLLRTYEMTVPVEMLTEELVSTQYQPSVHEVRKLQEQGAQLLLDKTQQKDHESSGKGAIEGGTLNGEASGDRQGDSGNHASQ